MGHGSPALDTQQEHRLRRRFMRVMGGGMLSTILALGLAHAWGWSVPTGIVLGSILGAIVLVGLLVGVGGFIVWGLTHAGKARPSWLHLAQINAPAEEVVFPDSQREHLVHGLSFPQSASAPYYSRQFGVPARPHGCAQNECVPLVGRISRACV